MTNLLYMYFRPLALMLALFFCSSSETQAQDVLKGVLMNAPILVCC